MLYSMLIGVKWSHKYARISQGLSKHVQTFGLVQGRHVMTKLVSKNERIIISLGESFVFVFHNYEILTQLSYGVQYSK